MQGTLDQTSPASGEDDWSDTVDRAVAGDRRAYGKLVRLVTGHLAHWRAYDFSADWDDIVQEVILSVVQAHAAGKVSASGAVKAYARQATRFKFIDRIRALKRQAPGADPEEVESQAEASWPPNGSVQHQSVEMRMSVWQAIDRLPERERLAVIEVHAHGRTYDEAAEITGIPLGTLKRALRTGLANLRLALEEEGQEQEGEAP